MPNAVHIYLTERTIDGSRYGEEICARSLAEAQELAARIGSVVLGTCEEQTCATCGTVLRGAVPIADNDDVLNATELY